MNSQLLKAVSIAALVTVASLAAGCEDEEPRRDETRAPAASRSGELDEPWLQPNSKLTPGQWLASRAARELKPLDDPDVKRLSAMLDRANKLYRESERMIANRTVQLESMLKDIGVTEQASEILDDLTQIAGEVGQTEGFGAVSQHYFNLRTNNIARGEALATLRARYGQRNSKKASEAHP